MCDVDHDHDQQRQITQYLLAATCAQKLALEIPIGTKVSLSSKVSHMHTSTMLINYNTFVLVPHSYPRSALETGRQKSPRWPSRLCKKAIEQISKMAYSANPPAQNMYI